ncbi:MAG: branched-chain amino acid ABC transporter permease [Bacillota bacterium]|nr:branched-chain amino acid ABC transporter permease [Bacillota bacterium]MDI7249062.1 branched-chain amino acid ABC transporter permease [Bacillota bacterium]
MYPFLFRLWRDFKGEILVLPGRSILFFGGVALFVFPLFSREPYLLRILTLSCIFAIFAASWDLLSGYVGQLNLGHAIFFGVAAYASALLNLHLGLPPWLTIPLGALVAVFTGLAVGIPCLRLKGQYLSLATLAFPIILTGLVFLFPDLTGGELGVSGLTRLAGSRLAEYYVSLTLAVGLCLLTWKITDSNLGIIFHAIREDEIAARASGINTPRYKLLAFCLSGFFAGISGGLYAHFMRLAGPGTLSVLTSFQPVIWTIFGGIATVYGAVVGVFVLFPLMEVLRLAPELRMFLYAAIIVLALRFVPEGIAPWLVDRMESECPRCKEHNAVTRKRCRACGTALRVPLQKGTPSPAGGMLKPRERGSVPR